ncbi:MAG: penicillin acylase family protein [Lewinellaceae bacterium]|nr:penicillin acylase family protein [Lewinellaceae bacterium]
MKILKFLSALVITGALLFVLGMEKPFGVQLPPIGGFFSPFSGFWQNAESAGAYKSGALNIEGTTAPVKVIFDRRMVPHIFAQSAEDAVFAQGYIHARFRLWQMDISARATGGTVAEVVGESGLNNDKEQRRKGMVFAAEKTVKNWQNAPFEWGLIQAYTNGVNAYIDQLSPKDYPLEFKLLNYRPEHWTPLKSALFFKKMSETLCGRSDDIAATRALRKVGKPLYDFLFPEYNPQQSPVIPIGTPWDFTPVEIPPAPENKVMIGNLSPDFNPAQPLPFMGSNNWALSGAKTASGYPVLCSDPHLQLTLPSVWFEVQLNAPGLNAYGVSFPSLPGILIGFNDHVAWAETNVEQDVLDWYAITWVNEEKTKYLLDNKPVNVEIREETILVRGQEPVVEKVKYTVWGPVVTEFPDNSHTDLAMRWVAHDAQNDGVSHDIGTFFNLMRATNYEDYSKALSTYDNPAQNFAFAARDGDIALKVNGRFPLRRPGQGKFVQDGSISGSAWPGFIPMDQVPQVKNPERGFVASSNQRSTGLDYPYYYFGYFDDYRGRYINRTLSSRSGFTLEDMAALQNDDYSLKAEEGVPLLVSLLDNSKLSPGEQSMLDTLKAWDFRFTADIKAPLIFEEWMRQVALLAFDEVEETAGEPIILPETWRMIDLLAHQPQDTIFDNRSTPETEDAGMIVSKAFHQAAATISDHWADPAYTWKDAKGTEIRHLARLPGMGSGLMPIGGYRDAPNALSRTAGPSWRMIVELGPQVKARGIYPGGQSGNPGSRYYDNMIGEWSKGKYQDLIFMKSPDDDPQSVLFTLEIN